MPVNSAVGKLQITVIILAEHLSGGFSSSQGQNLAWAPKSGAKKNYFSCQSQVSFSLEGRLPGNQRIPNALRIGKDARDARSTNNSRWFCVPPLLPKCYSPKCSLCVSQNADRQTSFCGAWGHPASGSRLSVICPALTQGTPSYYLAFVPRVRANSLQ